MPPDEDQTLRRRHRRVDKPEKPRDRRQDPTEPPERHHHLDKHLDNQAKPAQIPVHLNVLLRSQFQVPPPSPPSPTQQQAIPKLQHIRYLGVTFSKNCTFNQDVKETLKNLLATEPTSYTGFEGASVGAIRKPCTTSTNPSSVPSLNTAPTSTIFRLPDRFPSNNLHQETNTIPIQSRLKELQSRYVTRTLNSNNALAIQTLSNSFKYPSRDGRLLNRIPKSPKRKLKHPPTALLLPAYTDLPDDLQELLDSTPLTMR
jgi:hypothetical protein